MIKHMGNDELYIYIWGKIEDMASADTGIIINGASNPMGSGRPSMDNGGKVATSSMEWPCHPFIL